MVRMLVLTSMLAYGTTTAFAQTTGAGYDALPPSLAGVAKAMHTTIRGNLATAAEDMPAEEYAFRPTPEVRTFAQIIGHVVNANLFFCSQAAGEKPQARVNYETVADKAGTRRGAEAFTRRLRSRVCRHHRHELQSAGDDSGRWRRRAGSHRSWCRADVQHRSQQRALRKHRRLHAPEGTRSAFDGAGGPADQEITESFARVPRPECSA